MIALAIFAAAILLLFFAGIVYQKFGAAADLRRYPPPGRLVEVGSRRLHLLEKGTGSPTVVFESGLPGSVLSWSRVQEDLSKLVRTVSYDRAGLGWSDPCSGRRTAEAVVRELRHLLPSAGLEPPYILVGHSFGGLTCRLYAALYPDEVAGLVLVDPVGACEWAPLSERERHRLEVGARLCRRAERLSQFGLTRTVGFLARMGAGRLAKFAVALVSSGTMADAGTLIGPLARLTPQERAIVGTFWVQAKFYGAMAGQIEALPESAAQMIRAGDQLEGKPVIVISARDTPSQRLTEQLAIAGLSTQGRHLVAASSGHWIQLDEPELVAGAILEAIADLGRPPAAPGGRSASSRVH